jgi:hypothetical protein
MLTTGGRHVLLLASLMTATAFGASAQRGSDAPAPGRPADERPVPARLKNFKPVTDAILLNPDPADWIHTIAVCLCVAGSRTGRASVDRLAFVGLGTYVGGSSN